ncbi:3-hydroxyacyl-CoA dehydrogenase [Rhodococcus sp. 06-418-5]|uniref:SDR family NAD(P)-dependent oxidoreductase n=1 Tax=Rhodococcus sp. 06-418-5 TaxID=2022507 RepID=UPI000B9B3488|nr:SDR family NAD(P)-dependent oxidoreductase [Rhodococcus sp. 06-418-5]OZC79068.1 3-hydroxyacyl-CoA dehydrogenase [Rhodococcus sp. 06-418-5]
MRIANSVVVVTGGASGLGEQVARMVVAEGGRVVILDRPESAGNELATEMGDAAAFEPVDVSVPDQVERAVSRSVTRFGRVDVLVGCAGISPPGRVVNKAKRPFPLDRYRQCLDVNLIGAFDVIRTCAAAMVENEPDGDGSRGIVISIGSIAGIEGQVGQAAYAASKGGLIAMTLPIARDLAEWGIRSMTVCPGSMDTPMLAAAAPSVRQSLISEAVFPKRLGAASELARLVQHIVENGFLNGEVIRLDGALRLGPSPAS